MSTNQEKKGPAAIVRTWTEKDAGSPAASEDVARAIVAAAAPAEIDTKKADAWRDAVKAASVKAPKWIESRGLTSLAASVGVDPAVAAGMTRGKLRVAIRKTAADKIDGATLWDALWALAKGEGKDEKEQAESRRKAAKALYQNFCSSCEIEVIKGQLAASLRAKLTEGGQKAKVLPDRKTAATEKRRQKALDKAADDVEAALKLAGIDDPEKISAARVNAKAKAAEEWDEKHKKAD